MKGFKGLIDAIIHVKLEFNETEFNLTQMNFVCSEKDHKIVFMYRYLIYFIYFMCGGD